MKIAILYGGYSAEREVSIRSGQNVYKALKNKGVNCFLFDVKSDNLAQLFEYNFDKAFIILHGKGGEDGVIQAKLEAKDVAFSGSSSAVSKICMDKVCTKQIWQQHSLPTADFVLSINHKLNKQLGFALPWIIKPANEGSSIGISKISAKSQLKSALDLAHKYDDNVLIERYLDGKEYTIGIYRTKSGYTTLPIIEIAHNLDFLDYDSKYFDNEHLVKHICPAALDSTTTKQIQNLALKAFEVLGCKDWGRIDFFIERSKPYLLEINNIPGMTPASLIPISLKAANIDMANFIKQILL